MPESDRSKAADREAKRVALGRAPRASDWEEVGANLRAQAAARHAAWVAACDPRVREVMGQLDALIGARNPGVDAYFADCRPTPEETLLWNQLWDLLGEPGVAPVPRSVPFGPAEYVRVALYVQTRYWAPGCGRVPWAIDDRDWGGRVWPPHVYVDPMQYL